MQSPPTRRSAARSPAPAREAEQPKSTYARSLLQRLDDVDAHERKLLDEAAELDRTKGEPKSDEP